MATVTVNFIFADATGFPEANAAVRSLPLKATTTVAEVEQIIRSDNAVKAKRRHCRVWGEDVAHPLLQSRLQQSELFGYYPLFVCPDIPIAYFVDQAGTKVNLLVEFKGVGPSLITKQWPRLRALKLQQALLKFIQIEKFRAMAGGMGGMGRPQFGGHGSDDDDDDDDDYEQEMMRQQQRRTQGAGHMPPGMGFGQHDQEALRRARAKREQEEREAAAAKKIQTEKELSQQQTDMQAFFQASLRKSQEVPITQAEAPVVHEEDLDDYVDDDDVEDYDGEDEDIASLSDAEEDEGAGSEVDDD